MSLLAEKDPAEDLTTQGRQPAAQPRKNEDATLLAEPLQAVKNWLLAKNSKFGDFDLDFDLIENRVIDSLGFMDFVFFLESVTGRELATDAGSVDAFRTLRRIRETILLPGPRPENLGGG